MNYHIVRNRFHIRDLILTGTIVNGVIAGKSPSGGDRGGANPRTYLGEIVVIHGSFSIHVSPHKILVNNVTELKWKKSQVRDVKNSDVILEIEARKRIDVHLGDNIVFSILRHLVRPNHPFKVDFLGFYIKEASGLSNYTHGLIGKST